jgi:hypothetical protein
MHTPYGYFEPPLNNDPLLDTHVSRALQWCEHIMLDFSETGRPIRVEVRDGEPSIMCQVNGHVIELLPFEAARSVYGPEHTRFNDQVVPLKLDGADWPWISFTPTPPSSALDAMASLLLLLRTGAYSSLPSALLLALEMEDESEDRR